MLNIFFVVDKNYIIPFTVTLTSVLENNKELQIRVFIIHEIEPEEFLDNSREFFKRKYNLEINLIKIEDKWFDNFYISDHITKTIYFKFLLAEMLPKDIDHGLYLDCDIIVTGSLKKFNDSECFSKTENSKISLFAVKDIRSAREEKRIRSLGVEITNYFNAGVMFLNLKKIRADAVFKKIFPVTEKFNDQLTYWDQDVFNIIFKDDHENLEETYNSDGAIKYESLPIVIHYMGNSKPWHYIDNSPNKNLYYKYLELTPYKDENLEKITIEKFARKYVRLFRKKIF